MMAVNLGTLGPRDAAELVEYCNLRGGTHWSDERRKNGSTDPHGVSSGAWATRWTALGRQATARPLITR